MRCKSMVGAALFGALMAPGASFAASFLVASGDSTFINIGSEGGNRFLTNLIGGGSNVVAQDGLNSFFNGEVDGFYGGLAGVSYSAIGPTASIGPKRLAGQDLFVSVQPANDFTPAEAMALGSFLDGGGNVFVAGEYDVPSEPGNADRVAATASVNGLLSQLGSAMRIQSGGFDESGSETANGPLAANALTAGITSFDYGYAAPVEGGKTLFTTADSETPFIASEAYETSDTPKIPAPPALLLLASGAAALRWVGARSAA